MNGFWGRASKNEKKTTKKCNELIKRNFLHNQHNAIKKRVGYWDSISN